MCTIIYLVLALSAPSPPPLPREPLDAQASLPYSVLPGLWASSLLARSPIFACLNVEPGMIEIVSELKRPTTRILCLYLHLRSPVLRSALRIR